VGFWCTHFFPRETALRIDISTIGCRAGISFGLVCAVVVVARLSPGEKDRRLAQQPPYHDPACRLHLAASIASSRQG
jgi:hypothetical protein